MIRPDFGLGLACFAGRVLQRYRIKPQITGWVVLVWSGRTSPVQLIVVQADCRIWNLPVQALQWLAKLDFKYLTMMPGSPALFGDLLREFGSSKPIGDAVFRRDHTAWLLISEARRLGCLTPHQMDNDGQTAVIASDRLRQCGTEWEYYPTIVSGTRPGPLKLVRAQVHQGEPGSPVFCGDIPKSMRLSKATTDYPPFPGTKWENCETKSGTAQPLGSAMHQGGLEYSASRGTKYGFFHPGFHGVTRMPDLRQEQHFRLIIAARQEVSFPDGSWGRGWRRAGPLSFSRPAETGKESEAKRLPVPLNPHSNNTVSKRSAAGNSPELANILKKPPPTGSRESIPQRQLSDPNLSQAKQKNQAGEGISRKELDDIAEWVWNRFNKRLAIEKQRRGW